MKREITIGIAVLAGVVVFEAALIPGVILGSAAILAPRFFPGRRPNKIRRTAEPLQEKIILEPVKTPKRQRLLQFPKSAFGRSIAKTVTFRIIVTTLDFTTNYVVIGEIATAAGLSTFNVIAGPVFYFVHETAWNYLGAPESGSGVPELSAPPSRSVELPAGLTISPALAKTITYRTLATVVDFATNYVVVGSVVEATILSATGFLLGPFVYFGHEKAWEYLAIRSATTFDPASETTLLPSPS